MGLSESNGSTVRCQTKVLASYDSDSLPFRWLQEMDRKQAELVAVQIALENLRQRDQLLKTENEMLKVEDYTFILFSVFCAVRLFSFLRFLLASLAAFILCRWKMQVRRIK